MKQPWWKRWLSYLMDVRLETLSSEHNEELHVFLSRGRYQLCTQNAVYSFDDLYVNFHQAFKQLKVQNQELGEVLVLGLGLGSVPFMLEKHFGAKANYTAVEIDETVIYLAGKYSLHNLESPIQYLCSDAAVFVQTNEEEFDLICMDVFQDDVIPEYFESVEYLENLKTHLAPNGTLLYNRLAQLKKDIAATQAFFQGPFKQVFPNAHHIDVKGNWVLVGSSS